MAISGPSAPSAASTRFNKLPTFRFAANVLRTGRACTAPDRAACIAATAGDVTATATALRLALDMTDVEARKLPGIFFRNPTARAYQLRLRGTGTTADLSGGGA